MAKEADGRRTARVEREVLHVVAKFVLREMKEDLPGLVTISRVKMPGDLRAAKVYITLLNPEGDKKACMKQAVKILQQWAVEIQAEIESELKTRYTPKLTFYEDEAAETILNVDRLLAQLAPKKGSDE